MADGLISGILGGLKGLGTSVAKIGEDERKRIADRMDAQLKADLELKTDKELASFQNKLPLSASRKQEIEAQKTANIETQKEGLSLSKQLSTFQNELPMSKSEEQKMELQLKNDLEKIASGKESKFDKDKIDYLEGQARSLLAVKLGNAGIPISFDPSTGVLSNSQPLDETQQAQAKKIAGALGFEMSFTPAGEMDNPGWFTGKSQVSDIGAISRTYVSTSAIEDTVPVEQDEGKSLVQSLLTSERLPETKTYGPELPPGGIINSKTKGGFKTDLKDVELGAGMKEIADTIKKIKKTYSDYNW